MSMKLSFLTTLLTVAIGVGVGGAASAQSPAGDFQEPTQLGGFERVFADPPAGPATFPTATAADEKTPEDLRIRAAVERILKEKEDAHKADEAKKKAAADAEGYEVGSDLGMTAAWNHGLELSTKNKDFRVHVGGRTQMDASWYSVPENLERDPALTGLGNLYNDGVDFRRARFRVDGTMYEVVEWACEYDWVNGDRERNAVGNGVADTAITGFTDLWVQLKHLPVLGNVRIGNQKEPIGFEHLVSSRFLPFMERSFNQDSFYGGTFNGFTPGVQAFDTYWEDSGTWAIGVFKPVDNVFAYNIHDGDYAVTGRMTYLPYYECDGRSLLHVGGSVSQRSSVNDRMRFRTRGPERAGLSVQWPVLADVAFFAKDQTWTNTELVAVHDRWTFQAEYLFCHVYDAATVAGGNRADLTYHGGYCQLLYFLTPDHDNYNRKNGFFDRVIPREPFFLVPGCRGPIFGRGAWQVGLRYNYLDLNDNGFNGGVLHDVTCGLNWFLNPNLKMQFNYSATHREFPARADADGWIHGWGTRVAWDF